MTQRQTIDNGFREILTLVPASHSFQLCLASVVKEEVPQIQRVQISKTVADHFRNIIAEKITRWTQACDDGEIAFCNYDPMTKPDAHELEHLNLDDHSELKSQIINLKNIQELEAFASDDDFVAGIRFYVLAVLPEDGKPCYFFRTYTPKKELSRSKRFAMILRRGQYDKFDEQIFLFDDGIDCVVRDKILYIFNKNNFQKIFQFYEMLRSGAKETLQTIRTHIPIDDFPAFQAACEGHLLKLAKLKNIASKPYFKTITMKDIKKVISRFKLDITIAEVKGKELLHFDASDKWAILRLLDDDYLMSVMTGNQYEVNSKRTMEKQK